jgi:formamidopyrimidine-DNA glycosylase
MPELPEVEAVCRAVRPLVTGRRIRKCRVVHAIAVRPQSPAAFARAASGRIIRGVERRGKYLLFELDRGWLAAHFRLDGQLLWLPLNSESGGTKRSAGGSQPPGAMPHACVLLTLVRRARAPGVLGFVDPRHFGRIQYAASAAQLPGLRRLGIDPLSPQFTVAVLAALLRASRRPLKLLLMDQMRIAGLGNIYSSEALWRARLSPRRPSHHVHAREIRALHKAIVGILRAALECCLAPPPDFRDPQWWFQGLDRILRVYGREGAPCRRCGSAAPRGIRRITQSGRSSFFCPHCQK